MTTPSNPRLADILQNLAQAHDQIDFGLFFSALLASLAAAFVASLMYRFFYERRGTGSQIHRAFPLLAISITTLFIGVQVSLPLSLGLLGSLSIIRFRTPVKEPEEVGFVMLIIAAAISAATFNFQFIVILYLVAFASLLVVRGAAAVKWLRRDGILVLTAPRSTPVESMAAVEAAVKRLTVRYTLESSATHGDDASWQYIFSGLKTGVPELRAELEKACPGVSINVYLDRPGGIR